MIQIVDKSPPRINYIGMVWAGGAPGLVPAKSNSISCCVSIQPITEQYIKLTQFLTSLGTCTPHIDARQRTQLARQRVHRIQLSQQLFRIPIKCCIYALLAEIAMPVKQKVSIQRHGIRGQSHLQPNIPIQHWYGASGPIRRSR